MNYFSSMFNYDNDICITGLTDELTVFYVLERIKKNKKNQLIVVSSIYEANKMYNNIKSHYDNVYLFLMDDFITSVALAVSPELKVERLNTLKSIRNNSNYIVITNLMGYLHFLPRYNEEKIFEINLKKGVLIDRKILVDSLIKFGYKKESLVTSTGEFSVRGFVLDIFPIREDHPIRIEFFDNEIDSIRTFDSTSQMSISELNAINILPIDEIETTIKSSISEYMVSYETLFIDYNLILTSYTKLLEEIDEYNNSKDLTKKYMFKIDDIKVGDVYYIFGLNNIIENKKLIDYSSKEILFFNNNMSQFKDYVLKCINNHCTVVICLSNKSQINEICGVLNKSIITNENSIIKGQINIIKKKINKGFIVNDFVFISEYDIEKSQDNVNLYRNSYHIGRKIKGFDDIKVGDFVVHISHGIGKYGGVISLNQRGFIKDYVVIYYLNNDKIYVPASKINTIFKYSSKEGLEPKLSSLNSSSWKKRQQRIRTEIKNISKELLELYSERLKLTKNPYKDFAEEKVFASNFQFDETNDQTKCINEIDNDLKTNHPMDRLLCGDVGFGKTEVAFRAMFKAVLNGYQVAYLCPTTILSSQQFQSALKRFKDFAINIKLLNRYISSKEESMIVEGLEKGTVDIVIGTHKLLNNKIKYKNLGLLIVDEEQRFGVTHKEKIKQYKNDVNVLTLSATPIPRTLKMSLAGLRDLSIIDTAPMNRYPIQTYVIEENDLLIKDAIYKEMSRKGQIYILYNNISKLEGIMQKINVLVPEARVVISHGQMLKNEIENIMTDFVDYKYDIMLCTTIIETGIDISNANTLIIYNADSFGLSQLYQIRGRVGRSNRIAYAYLMYDKNKMLNDIAIKRLKSIKEFTELGSGYKIAMRDLSLRGAGDVLGATQAGFVDEVGIDLYMKMINDEMNNESEEDNEYENSLLNVDTHINDEYVSDEDIKIEIHKKINDIDSMESLMNTKQELEDRFGKILPELEIYMYEELFEKMCYKLNISNVNQTDYFVTLELKGDIVNKLKMDKIFILASNICGSFSFKYQKNRLLVTLPINNIKKHFIYYLTDFLFVIINELN